MFSMDVVEKRAQWGHVRFTLLYFTFEAWVGSCGDGVGRLLS